MSDSPDIQLDDIERRVSVLPTAIQSTPPGDLTIVPAGEQKKARDLRSGAAYLATISEDCCL